MLLPEGFSWVGHRYSLFLIKDSFNRLTHKPLDWKDELARKVFNRGLASPIGQGA